MQPRPADSQPHKLRRTPPHPPSAAQRTFCGGEPGGGDCGHGRQCRSRSASEPSSKRLRPPEARRGGALKTSGRRGR
eukprot:9027947-Alexandrium_andersonii.AAC.1